MGLQKFNVASKRNDKVKEILEWHKMDTEERSDWLELQNYYYSLTVGKVGRPSVPWEGASDLHWPLIDAKIESIVPRYVESMFGSDPVARVIPTEFSDVDESYEEEKFLNWTLRNEIPDFYKEMNNWIRVAVRQGTSILKTTWEEDWRRSRKKFTISRYVAPGDEIAGVKNDSQEVIEITDEDIIDHFWQVKDNIEKRGDHKYKAKIKEGDRWVEAGIEIVWPETDDEDTVEVYIESDMLLYQGPKVKVIRLEDGYVPYRTESEQTCQHFLEECFVSLDDLAARREEDIYKFTDKEWKELVKIDKKHRDAKYFPEEPPRQQTVDEQQGLANMYFNHGKFSVFEVYAFDDIDGDYRDEHLIYTVVPCVEALCRAEYLEEQFPHGHRPYSVLRYKPVDGQFYGRGVAEMLAGLQIEANTIINLTNDRENLINLPFFFYEPAPGTDPNQHVSVRPGEGIPIAPGTQVTFPNWGKNPVGGMEVLNVINQVAEELVGHGPMQTGQRREGSVPRTARGTNALIAEGNIKTNMDIKLAQEGGFKEMLYQVFSLYSEFGPEEKYYRIVGEPRPRKISRKSLKGRYDFQLYGNTINTNPEIKRNKSTMLYQLFAAEPLYQQDLSARVELLKIILKSFNDGELNVDSLTPNIPVQLRPRTPDEVIGLLIQGLRIEPRPGEDPMAMAQAIDAFANSPQIESVPKQYVGLFAEAVQAYATMAMLQEQLQSLVARQPKASFQPGGNDQSPAQPGLPPQPSEGMMEPGK